MCDICLFHSLTIVMFFPPGPGLKSPQSPLIDQVHTHIESYLPTLVEVASGEQLEIKEGEAGSWVN